MSSIKSQVSSVKYQVSGVECQVSSILYTGEEVLVPSLKVPALGPEPPKYHKFARLLNSPLGDLAAQACSESVRGPQSMGKRKLRASDGPKVLENVSSNHSWAAQHLPWPS